MDDDERDATRTLFIGNLDYDIHCNDLKRIFDPFGFIEEIDIKRQQQPSHSMLNGSETLRAFAFIKYSNMDMAYLAKSKLNGKKIGKNECRIGYGKITIKTNNLIGHSSLSVIL
jgi:RNA-binding protein 15